MSLLPSVLCLPRRAPAKKAPLLALLAIALASLAWLPGKAAAQPANPATAVSRPLWNELTPAQQQALKPLEPSWNAISEGQKQEWLELSKNYSALLESDRATLHSRMTEWMALTPQQRAAARLNFGKTQELARELTAQEKKAKWEQYQALSPEEKQKLGSAANARPAGAAAAIKPVEPQKLAPVAPAAGRPPPGQFPQGLP